LEFRQIYFVLLLGCLLQPNVIFGQQDPITVSTKTKGLYTELPKGIELPQVSAEKQQLLDSLVATKKKKTDVAISSKLESLIKYSAKDSVTISQTQKKIYLSNEASIDYTDTKLTAGVIAIDYLKNEILAGRYVDSKGERSQTPEFTQGQNEVIPDSIRYNITSQKALIFNSRTEQGAGIGGMGGGETMKVVTEKTKKENDSVFYFSQGKLTTALDSIDPDYYIKVRKAKFIPGKRIIAGFSNMYLVDVPTPIALPFAIFPLTSGRSGGLIFPTITNDPQRGYSVQNGGYYFPISDYVDLNLTGDYFTNGSYGFRAQSVYTKRYKFRGNVNLRFENLITSQKGFADYSRNSIFNLQISHSQDPKASPNSRFAASVNIGSSKYFRNSANQQNLALTQNNNLSSSITYSKTFPAYPSVNLNLSATHNQNTNTEEINLTLPTAQVNMERIFPFAKREGIKKGLIQNVNLQYTSRFENRIRTTDSLFLTSKMFDDAKVGARHTIPLSTNFKLAKFLSVSMGANYEDLWTFETFTRGQDPNSDVSREIVLDTVRGFDRFNRYGVSSSIGTTVYGTYTFKEGKKLQAIRHVARPSVGWSYGPSFERYYDTYTNLDGQEVSYSRFEGTLNGSPSLGKSNSLSFGLQNTLEAKMASKDSTKTEPRKIPILSNLNFSSAYNLEADSLRLSPVSFNAATALFNQEMRVNMSGTLDPYVTTADGTRINTFHIAQSGKLAKLTRASLNFSYALSNETFKPRNEEAQQGSQRSDSQGYDNDYRAQSGGADNDLFGFGLTDNFPGEERNGGNQEESEEDPESNTFYVNRIPWSLNLQFNSSYSNLQDEREITSASLMFSGNIDLTPAWKLRVSSGYDFKNQGFNLTQIGFKRDLKSFDLRFNWVPFGQNARWDFFIGIKSAMLSDLKWESRSQRNFNR